MRALRNSDVRRIRQIAIAVALVLTLTGCGGDTGEDATIPDPTDQPMTIDTPSTFDGRTVTLSIRRGQTINTTNHSYTASPLPVLHSPEYSAREWLVPANAQLTGLVHATWNTQDQTDYVTFGAWAEQSASNAGTPLSPVATGVVFDGPEFRHATPLSASTERATYRGTAMGVYKNTASPGTDHGFFAGEVELNADFEQQRINGCIGCDTIGIGTYPAGLPAVSSLARLSDALIRLEQGTITNANSTYTGARITAESKSGAFPIQDSSGNWRGAFSSRQDDLGNPRAVGGMADGQITWENADTLSFSTAFIGGSQ